VGLATSGSGDVLAGLITGLAARGADPLTASLWANHLHRAAGDRCAAARGTFGFLARELLDETPLALRALSGV
jgi:ADP-dependent NAD(P)H-hydrate dehydratase